MIVTAKCEDHFITGYINSNDDLPDYVTEETLNAPSNRKVRILKNGVMIAGRSNATLDYLELFPKLSEVTELTPEFILNELIPYLTDRLNEIGCLGSAMNKFATQFVMLKDRCFMISHDFYVREVTDIDWTGLSVDCESFYCGASELYKDNPPKERVLKMLKAARDYFRLCCPIYIADGKTGKVVKVNERNIRV